MEYLPIGLIIVFRAGALTVTYTGSHVGAVIDTTISIIVKTIAALRQRNRRIGGNRSGGVCQRWHITVAVCLAVTLSLWNISRLAFHLHHPELSVLALPDHRQDNATFHSCDLGIDAGP